MAKKKIKLKPSSDFVGLLTEDGATSSGIDTDSGVIGIKTPNKFTFSVGGDDPHGVFGVVKAGKNLTWTYSLDNDNPEVDALALGQGLSQLYQITIKAKGYKTIKEKVSITIEGRNDAPEITSNEETSVGEGTEAVLILAATDVDFGASLNYSIVDDLDADFFEIVDTANGPELRFKDPSISDDVPYLVKVRATDEFGAFDEQEIAVTVNPADIL